MADEDDTVAIVNLHVLGVKCDIIASVAKGSDG
jgi:hypothetical protein